MPAHLLSPESALKKDECRFRGRLSRLESCEGNTGRAVWRTCCCLKCRISCPVSPLVIECQLLLSEVGRFSKGSTSFKSSHFDVITIKKIYDFDATH